jgi:hypothetical protein
MIRKKIFLASSSELKEDREQFEIFINRKNKDWIDKDIFLELIVWEDFLDAMSKTRLQDEYNQAVQNSDIFVMLFFTKMGQYTREEFETAFGQFKATNRPLIFTYFRDAEIRISSINKNDFMSLWAFKERLDDLGHFYTTYSNIDDLKFKFGQQLDKLLASGALTQQIGNRVLAFWSPDHYWYPGTVADIRGNRFLIKYDDGYQEWMPLENIISLDYGTGDPVECRWKGLNLYYPAHIIDVNGDKLMVQYDYDSFHDVSPDSTFDNGPSLAEKEETNIRFLRFKK